jgi:K+-transporting ATPase ATPase C chain
MMRRQALTGLLMTVVMMVLLGFLYPLAVTAVSQLFMKDKANGSLVKANGKVVGSSLLGQNFTDSDGKPLPQYLQPRPSKAGEGYDGLASSASNLAPSNAKLIGNVPGVAYDSDGKQLKHNAYATTEDAYCVPVPATDEDGNDIVDTKGNPVYEKTANGEYACDPDTIPQRTLAYRSFNGLADDVKVPADAVTASGSGLDPHVSLANARLQATRIAEARDVSVKQVQEVIDAHTEARRLGFLGEQTVNVLRVNLALDELKS